MDTWRDFSNLEKIRDNASKSRILHISRPVLLHDRAPKGNTKKCPCCNSVHARIVRKIQHIELLLDTWTGKRTFRTKKNRAKFDRIAYSDGTERLYMPLRCSKPQWKFIKDLRYCIRRGKMRKVTAIFAGNRAGKTALTKEIASDLFLLMGGPGTKFLFVAPTTKMCLIDIGKMFVGEHDASKIPPLIPPRLVLDYPKTEQQITYKSARLIEGSEFVYKHANGNGDNIKGIHANAIFATELCAVRDIGNWHVMLNRTMGTAGGTFVDSTPMSGHWAKEEIHDRASTLAKAKPDTELISDRVSCFDNPWYSPEQVDATINALGDPRLIDREVHGKWVPMGNILWEYWDAEQMATDDWRTCEDLGFVNITDRVMRPFFKSYPRDKKINSFGGLDYNRFPMSLIELQIGVKPDANASDPKNWHVFCLSEVVENGGTQKLCEVLKSGQAAKALRYPPDYFLGFPIAADPSGSLDHIPSGHGVEPKTASSLAEYMNLQGFCVEAANRSVERSRPALPGQLDSLNLCHTLMFEGRYHVARPWCKKLIHGHEAQEADLDGRILKESGKPTDKLSSQTDAMRYGVWAALHRNEPGYRKTAKWLR